MADGVLSMKKTMKKDADRLKTMLADALGTADEPDFLNALSQWLPGEIGAEITELKVNGSGWSNLIIEINRQWILRLSRSLIEPERKLPSPRFELEQRLIAGISDIQAGTKNSPELPQMPLMRLFTPHQHTVFSATKSTQAFAALYPRISGRHHSSEELSNQLADSLARAIATFLARLHALAPSQELIKQGLRPYPYGDAHFLQEVLPASLNQLSKQGQYAAERYFSQTVARFENLSPSPMWICHGDFGPGNLLFDDEANLSGILDFSDACLGDPAIDFAPLWRRTSTAFFAMLLKQYQKQLPSTQWQQIQPETLAERIRFQSLRKAAFVIWYAKRHGFEAGMQGSLDYLRQTFEPH